MSNIKYLATFNSIILLGTSYYCTYTDHTLYIYLLIVSSIVSYFLWVRLLNTKEAIISLILTLSGVLLFFTWSIPLGLEAPIFSFLPILLGKYRKDSTGKTKSFYFYTYMIVQIPCMLILVYCAYSESVNGVLDPDFQNSSFISDFLSIVHCTPDENISINVKIDPNNQTLSGEVSGIPVSILARSTVKAAIGTYAIKASGLPGPDFGTTKGSLALAKTFKVTKIAACIGGSLALGSSFFDLFLKK